MDPNAIENEIVGMESGSPPLMPPAHPDTVTGNDPTSIEPTLDQNGQPVPPVEGDEPLQPKDDPSRFQFWQSQYDRLRKNVEPYQEMVPLMRALVTRPDLLAQVQSGLMSPATAMGEMNTPEVEAVPVAPTRPKNFDPSEAWQNPESESYQYREAQEQYQQDQIQFLVRRDQARDQALHGMLEAQAQERQASERILQMKATAIAKGVAEPDIDSFMSSFTNPDPEQMMADLVELFNMRKSRGQNSPQITTQAQRAKDVLTQKLGQRAPMPLAGAPGSGEPPPLNPGQAFSASLRRAARGS